MVEKILNSERKKSNNNFRKKNLYASLNQIIHDYFILNLKFDQILI